MPARAARTPITQDLFLGLRASLPIDDRSQTQVGAVRSETGSKMQNENPLSRFHGELHLAVNAPALVCIMHSPHSATAWRHASTQSAANSALRCAIQTS